MEGKGLKCGMGGGPQAVDEAFHIAVPQVCFVNMQ